MIINKHRLSTNFSQITYDLTVVENDKCIQETTWQKPYLMHLIITIPTVSGKPIFSFINLRPIPVKKRGQHARELRWYKLKNMYNIYLCIKSVYQRLNPLPGLLCGHHRGKSFLSNSIFLSISRHFAYFDNLHACAAPFKLPIPSINGILLF
jgi:hypothetical protein